MRFNEDGNANDIQDRRGMGGVTGMRAGGISLGGIALVTVVALLTGQNPLALLGRVMQDQQGQAPSGGGPATPSGPRTPAEAQAEQLVRRATTDIENFWATALPAQGHRAFDRTQLVLFTDETQSGCGSAETQTGPFYCPADHLVYIDLGFYNELATRFGAPGQFAQAYVLAHEFGHHIQSQLGIESHMRAAQQANPGARNALSVSLELQADCFAGVWGASAARRNLLDPGDVQQGITAAGAVGDDRLQRAAGRRVNPESFTHGSSAQRIEWFQRGMQAGDISACTTFDGKLAP